MGSPTSRVFLELRSINGRLGRIEDKLRFIVAFLKEPGAPGKVVYLASASERTLDALKGLGRPATASEVSRETGRSRANESLHLCQLRAQGLVICCPRGREKFFELKVKEEHYAER